MGQLSPKKVLDDARPTESTNLEGPAVGTAGLPPGWGSPRMQGRASRIRPVPTRPNRAAPSLGGPNGRKNWPSSLNLKSSIVKEQVPLGFASSASPRGVFDSATSSRRRKRRHRLSPVAPFDIK
jgi:hypothetical protein